MDKERLINKVNEGKYSKEQLIAWINCLPSTTAKRKPIEYKVGDVLMHNFFNHPYILLKKRKDGWLCGTLTSHADCPEILEASQSRFFSENYITKVLFTTVKPEGNL